LSSYGNGVECTYVMQIFLFSICGTVIAPCTHIYIGIPTLVGSNTMVQDGRSRIRIPLRSLDLSIDLIKQHYGPGVDSASNRNEYQESFWGYRAADA
jgi:hypothetical protein